MPQLILGDGAIAPAFRSASLLFTKSWGKCKKADGEYISFANNI
ncbi:hypothetical protein [Nostoc sp.]